MNKLKQILKGINHRSYILFSIFLALLIASLFVFWNSYLRTWDSLITFFESFIFLFKRKKEIDGVPVLPNEPSINEVMIPNSIKEFIYLFKTWAVILFNKDFIIISTYELIRFIINVLQFAIFIPYLVIVWLLIKRLILKSKENEEYTESRSLKKFKLLEEKYLVPLSVYFESWRIYLKYYVPGYFKVLFMGLFLLVYRILAMGIDFLSFYLVFTKTFNITRIMPLLGSYIIDIIIILLEYSKVAIFIPIVVYFIRKRHKIARQRLQKMQAYNREEQMLHGVSNMISGPPGTGKTELMTALSFLANEELIYKALEKLKKFAKMFPDFPWPRLESYIRDGIKERVFVNRAQLGENLKTIYRNAINENKEDRLFVYLFNYDPLHQKTIHFDGIKSISLGEAISTYAEAFFIYDSRKPLHHSNYSVDHHFKVFGHFPLYNFNTIEMDKEDTTHNLAHIIKFDAHRLYNKVGVSFDDEEDSFLMDGQVETITEIDKERGNRTTQSGQKMDEFDANQLNDGFNDSIKTIRHEYTIDGTPFVKIYNDTQRQNSVNADLRETNEGRIEIQHRSEPQVALPLFEFDYLIWGTIANNLDDYLIEFRSLRNDGTLYNYLLNKIASMAGNRLQSLYNVYSYSKLSYKYRRNVSSESAGDASNRLFFMINQVTRANNYATDAYSEYFKSERLKATKGFYDAPQYKTYRASVEEIDAQGSYWGSKLKSMTKTVVENKETEVYNYE